METNRCCVRFAQGFLWERMWLDWQSGRAERLIEELFHRRLLINIGKGGVGKSIVTASLAQAAVAQGKRVLVCEINAKARMPEMLGGTSPESLDTLDRIWQVRENLWTVNITPRESMQEYIVQVLRLKLLYNLVFENRYVRSFLTAVPGLQELVYIGKIWYHTTEVRKDGSPRFDVILVDSPSTGHGISMLQIPHVIVKTVPLGPMHTAAKKILHVLRDPSQTCVNLVTLPEEMPVNETLELHQKVDEVLRLPLGGLFVNQWPLAPCEEKQRGILEEVLASKPYPNDGKVLLQLAEDAYEKRCKAEEFLVLLEKELKLPTLCLPRLPLRGDLRLAEELCEEFLARHTAR